MEKRNYWEWREEQRKEWEKYSITQPNKRLKRGAVGAVVMAAVMMLLVFLATIEGDSEETQHTVFLFRIFAGALALTGIILYMVLYYRISHAALTERWRQKDKINKGL